MKTRIEEVDELISELKKKMMFYPAWLKKEMEELVSLEIEKHDLTGHSVP